MDSIPKSPRAQVGNPTSRLNDIYAIPFQLLMEMIYLSQAEIKQLAMRADSAFWRGEEVAYFQLTQPCIDEGEIAKGTVIAVQRDERDPSLLVMTPDEVEASNDASVRFFKAWGGVS